MNVVSGTFLGRSVGMVVLVSGPRAISLVETCDETENPSSRACGKKSGRAKLPDKMGPLEILRDHVPKEQYEARRGSVPSSPRRA